MAEKKAKGGGEEFATRQKQAADTSKVDEKLASQGQGPPTAQAKDINSLAPAPGKDAGEEQIQARVDAEEQAGVRGIIPDPTPNEAYTVAGVTSGAPTPETDEDLRREAKDARRIDGPAPL